MLHALDGSRSLRSNVTRRHQARLMELEQWNVARAKTLLQAPFKKGGWNHA
jgi:hypothetical protein